MQTASGIPRAGSYEMLDDHETATELILFKGVAAEIPRFLHISNRVYLSETSLDSLTQPANNFKQSPSKAYHQS